MGAGSGPCRLCGAVGGGRRSARGWCGRSRGPEPPREPLRHGGSPQSRLGPGAARGAEEFSASPSRRGARDERAPARPQRGAAARPAGLAVLRARVLKSLEFNLKTRSAHLPTRRSPLKIPNSLLFTAPIQEKAIKQECVSLIMLPLTKCVKTQNHSSKDDIFICSFTRILNFALYSCHILTVSRIYRKGYE